MQRAQWLADRIAGKPLYSSVRFSVVLPWAEGNQLVLVLRPTSSTPQSASLPYGLECEVIYEGALAVSRTLDERYNWKAVTRYPRDFGAPALAGGKYEVRWYQHSFLANSPTPFVSAGRTLLGARRFTVERGADGALKVKL